jgi:hypothetical protein
VNTRYLAQAFGLRSKGQMSQKAANELGRTVICHVQPSQAVAGMRPISPPKVLVQTEKRRLWQSVQDRQQIPVIGAPDAHVHADYSEANPPLTQQEPLAGGQVFVEH